MAIPTPAPTVGGVYTMAEAARLKGVSYHTVSRAVRAGRLPVQRLGRMAMIAADDLEAWRPMTERAPHKYRRRQPDPTASPALMDLAAGEATELVRRLSLLYEAIDAAALELPLADFLVLLSQRLCEALDLKRVVVWGVDEARDVTMRLASAGPPISAAPQELPLSQWSAFREYLHHGTVMVADANTFGQPPGPLHDVTTLLVAPLRIGDRALGALIGDCGGDPFTLTDDQLDLARGLAQHAAVALELARLRAEVKSLQPTAN